MSETADELRERLRNGRKARIAAESGDSTGSSNDSTASSTGSASIGHGTDFSNQDRSNEQPVQGLHNGVRGVVGTANNTKRKLDKLAGSLAQINQRERSRVGRSGKDHVSSGPDGTDIPASFTAGTVRSVGNLITDEPIPTRNFNEQAETAGEKSEVEGTASTRKRGRQAKQGNSGTVQPQKVRLLPISAPTDEEIKKPRKPNFLNAPTLSKQEAKELAEPLATALKDELALVDKALWSISGDPLQQPIWGDISDKEMESITNIVLKFGQKSPIVATAARTAVDGSDYIAVGVIMAPRAQKTLEIVREARKRGKQQNENQDRPNRLQRARDRRREAITSRASEGYRGI